MGDEETRVKIGHRDARGRFLPGQTGNTQGLGGRPPVVRHIRELAREQTDTAFAALVDIALNGESETARVAALKELFDRGWGKSAQPLTGEDGTGPIAITWMNTGEKADDDDG